MIWEISKYGVAAVAAKSYSGERPKLGGIMSLNRRISEFCTMHGPWLSEGGKASIVRIRRWTTCAMQEEVCPVTARLGQHVWFACPWPCFVAEGPMHLGGLSRRKINSSQWISTIEPSRALNGTAVQGDSAPHTRGVRCCVTGSTTFGDYGMRTLAPHFCGGFCSCEDGLPQQLNCGVPRG